VTNYNILKLCCVDLTEFKKKLLPLFTEKTKNRICFLVNFFFSTHCSRLSFDNKYCNIDSPVAVLGKSQGGGAKNLFTHFILFIYQGQ